MSLYETIETMLPEFSKNERKIADHILKYPYDLSRYGGDAIALTCNVSRSAVIRFCHKLGFTGYADFRKAFMEEPLPDRTGSEETTNGVLDIYRNCILEMDRNVNRDELMAVSDLILHASHTVVFGQYHSGMSARQLSFRLNRQGIDSHAIDDLTIMENYTSILKQGDVAVIISITGQKNYEDHLRAMRQNRCPIVLITMTPTSPIAKYADHVLVCPTAIYSSSTYLLDEAICFFLMIEMIIECINKKITANNRLAQKEA